MEPTCIYCSLPIKKVRSDRTPGGKKFWRHNATGFKFCAQPLDTMAKPLFGWAVLINPSGSKDIQNA